MSFPDEVKAAIALLGGPAEERVVDFLADPGAACRALDLLPDHGGLVVRAAPESGPAREGYGPAPVAPLWIRLMRGAREIGTAHLHKADGMVRQAERVEIEEHREPCCDAASCDRQRTRASVWLVLGVFPDAPTRLLLAEQRSEQEPTTALAVAARIGTALGVPIHRAGVPVDLAAGEAPEPTAGDVATPSLARFAVRGEGDLVVLRDWDSRGPRESARRNGWIGGALLFLAALAWLQLFHAIAVGAALGERVGFGASAALLSLMGYAFAGVAHFSSRYQATSAPLVAVGRDRIMVLPWVGRDGAVDVRPEGRLGAAISLGEVRPPRPRPGEEGVAVELDTDHGPIDVMICPDAPTADLWCAVLARIVDEARHPRAGASARQRARQRAAA